MAGLKVTVSEFDPMKLHIAGQVGKPLARLFSCWDGSTCDRSVENILHLLEAGAKLSKEVLTPPRRPPLMPFQRDGVRYLLKHKGRALVADEMGLGKTVQALTYLDAAEDALPAVIVCPATLKSNWRREVGKWTTLSCHVIEGTKQYTLPDRDLIIINYELLRGKRGKSWPEWLRKQLGGIRSVVVDEIHRVKTYKAQQSTAVRRLCNKVPHVIGLSGTPIENRPAELLGILRIIDPDLFPDRIAFLERYCELQFDGYRWVAKGAANVKELHDILSTRIMIRRLKEQVLTQLPAKRTSVLPLALAPAGRAEYLKKEEEYRNWIRIAEPSPFEAQHRAQKLLDFCIDIKTKAGIEWVRNFLDNGEKLVVFCHHHRVVEALRQAFAGKCVVMDGASRDRQKLVDRFQKDPATTLFIGTLAAIEGITLTAASSVAFLELWWSPGKHDQAADRVHRIGQTASAVNVYYLIAEGTIEEKVAALLDNKRKAISKVVDGRQADGGSLIHSLIKQYRRNW